MSIRLTNDIRRTITKDVLHHRFSREVDALIQDRADLANDVYNDVYPKSIRTRMANLPAGWLPEDSKINAKFGESGGTYLYLPFNGHPFNELGRYQNGQHQAEMRRIQSRHVHGCAKIYPDGHQLSIRVRALKAKTNDLLQEVRRADREIQAALNSVSTIKRLIETWPEVEPFTKQFSKKSTPNLPAIPTGKLNQMLGLPV